MRSAGLSGAPADVVNRGLAHGILRVTLGINICLHGVQRFPQLGAFAGGVIKQFHGILPAAVVVPYANGLPFAEAIVGALLIAGAAQRVSLVASALLMASLTFGIALRGEHEVLAEQLGYEIVYALLLASLTWDRFSVDAVIRSRRPAPERQISSVAAPINAGFDLRYP
jgi:thiosulfate dehydrogenase [quinone] large subunit